MHPQDLSAVSKGDYSLSVREYSLVVKDVYTMVREFSAKRYHFQNKQGLKKNTI